MPQPIPCQIKAGSNLKMTDKHAAEFSKTTWLDIDQSVLGHSII